MHFQNIHSYSYQKALLHTLFCLLLKSSKAFSVSLNYGNLSWESAHKTNLKKIASRQKQIIRIIESDTVTRTTEKMEKLKVLNIYKINLYQSLIFIFRVKNNRACYK